MATPARYLFDIDFSAPPPPPMPEPDPEPVAPPRPMIDLEDHQAELAAAIEKARAEGHEEGYMEGRMAAEARAAERLADEAARLSAAVRSLVASQDAERLAVERQAVELAVAVARKLAGRLIDAEPLAEIRALVAESLGPLRKAPHLVLRLAAAHADGIRGEVDRIARETGFEGRVVILGEEDLGPGDCRIEWADGGIVRDRAALDAEVEAAVARYFEGRAASLATIHDDPVDADRTRG
ncbi:flagellar assembly protein FliH [Methyloraptor flagellatus]|uniref:FliH/SctL family protein n=1 Tax=Methyloraptor flagellatus TaxID=3162530 RepID=A0AAU7XB81_9HYPH